MSNGGICRIHTLPAVPEKGLAISPEFDAAPLEQRIAHVQELWDRIAQSESEVSIPDHHKRILDDRLVDLESARSGSRSWGEVREQLFRKLRND